MENEKQFVIDTSKIRTDEKGKDFKKATIEHVLSTIEEKKPFDVGDLVMTLEGPHAHMGLMVVEKKEDGIVRIAPAPNTPTEEIHESKLWHFDDYHEAFKVALIEEQNTDLDNPQ